MQFIISSWLRSKPIRSILLLLICGMTLVHANAQTTSPRLKITHLTDQFYVYTTYNSYQGFQIPAHGMYLVTNEGVVLFDTPWDTTQFQPLIDSIQARHQQPVTICIATHWHSDRTEGLAYYRTKGIRTYTTVLTDEWSRRHNKKRAEFLLADDTVFQVGAYRFQTFYPGEGHTADNIIIWFEKEKVLYGGCLIKGASATDLGNLEDANVQQYEATLKRVQRKCRDPRFIIVSHSDWNNRNSLQHSIRLARKLRKQGK